jgi:putative heme-binding domain-containing protein
MLLSASWSDPQAVRAALQMFRDGKLAAEERLAALQALAVAGEVRAVAAAAQVLDDADASQEFRGAVIDGLARFSQPAAGQALAASYAGLPAALQPRVVEALTQRGAWSRLLMDAIGNRQIPAHALNANQVAGLLSGADKELADLIRQRWGTVRTERNPQREQVIAQWRGRLSAGHGDPLRGLQVFAKVCGQCHKIYGAGQEVGPDLTANGRSSFEQLLSNVFDPSLVIGAAYQAVAIRTEAGRAITGLLVEDSPMRVVLKVQGGKLEIVPREEIAAQRISQLSLMPEGLEKQLSPQELQDLFAMLALDRHPQDPDARRIPP